MMTSRWRRRPKGSNWGDFGPDDQIGCLNYLTPKKVIEGIAEVKKGLSFSLSLPLDYPGGKKLNPNRNLSILRSLKCQNDISYNCEMNYPRLIRCFK